MQVERNHLNIPHQQSLDGDNVRVSQAMRDQCSTPFRPPGMEDIGANFLEHTLDYECINPKESRPAQARWNFEQVKHRSFFVKGIIPLQMFAECDYMKLEALIFLQFIKQHALPRQRVLLWKTLQWRRQIRQPFNRKIRNPSHSFSCVSHNKLPLSGKRASVADFVLPHRIQSLRAHSNADSVAGERSLYL